MTAEPWNDVQYRRIDRVAHRNGVVHVRFANGDEVDVAATLLSPQGATMPDWDHLACDGIELEVPTEAGPHYVLWETIRELTDPAYLKRLKDADAIYRIETGQRIRMLRESRGMTATYVAARAGINNQSLSRIERGKRGVTLTTLRRILDVMGYTLSDMVIDHAEPAEDTTAAGRARVSG
jgi:DNA-binding XRE family transcriptional regulator